MDEPGHRARALRPLVVLVGTVVVLGAAPARVAAATPDEILAGLRPDYAHYVRSIRIVSLHSAAVSPAGIYSGLVRPGGRDPRIREDAPLPGEGRSEIILYPDATDPSRGPGWLALILDHEYYHARHLAGAMGVPLADFGDASVNTSYYEALAWGYVLDQARAGAYGTLAPADLREVAASARRHYGAFRSFVDRAQPSAWLHYGRFLRDPGETPAAGGHPGEMTAAAAD